MKEYLIALQPEEKEIALKILVRCPPAFQF